MIFRSTGTIRALSVAFVFGIGVVLGCSSSTFSSLINQGVLSLSSDNPYLGSNLFLSKEIESSAYLFNFFQAKGSPTAIELRDKSGELEVRMFYPREKEMYIARAHESDRRKEWIVRGPYAIDRQYSRELTLMENAAHDDAVFDLWGKEHRFRTSAQPERSEVLIPVFVPTPTPAPTPKPRVKKAATPTPAGTPTPAAPMNFDQEALRSRSELAERNPSGDVIHTVKAVNETISQIATWYTGSADNAKLIAEKNGMQPDATLSVGAKITIPAASVTNPKIMK